ncbi:hypothetical protein ACU68Y_08855 [Finegoldia sp. P1-F-LS]
MKKRFLSLIIALAMMVGVFTPLIASAEGEKYENSTNKIVIHKILLNEADYNAWKPEDHKTTKVDDIKTYFGDNLS